ncbi:hypothetical protein [Sphingobium yanoikuyae]|jgi:hypothetical protein|uniref:hypothetical protein n=1 Tax=Sphingobium yanoikuyae TaxID=13690 RepID=UPI0028A84C0A|nr:hypothetical protein [Sphingobium yanoikuyae]
MFQQIDLNAVATFVLDVCDYSPDYEDDSFVVEVEGARFYVERKCNWFVLHVGQLKHRLPR